MPITELTEALSPLYGPRLLTGPAQTVAYASDWLTAFRSSPALVVLPESQAEVIKTVRLCFEHDVPLRGAGAAARAYRAARCPSRGAWSSP